MVKRKSAGWITYVGALLVVIIIVGVVARFTNGFKIGRASCRERV